jgi:hypothetical protein
LNALVQGPEGAPAVVAVVAARMVVAEVVVEGPAEQPWVGIASIRLRPWAQMPVFKAAISIKMQGL